MLCDGDHGIQLGDCYPACTLDASGSHGCAGKNACNFFSYSLSPTPVARGFCHGGCQTDADCPSGNLCQKDLAYCRTPPNIYVVSKAVGTPCDQSDIDVNCNCGGRTTQTFGDFCTVACKMGDTTCPSAFSCDAMIQTSDPVTGQALLGSVPAGTWGSCAKNCAVDADCASINGHCLLHAGMSQKTCDTDPRLGSSADAGVDAPGDGS
jgi:hypothetical protein